MSLKTESDLRAHKDQLAALHGEMDAILAAGKENDGKLSDEQTTQFAELDTKCGEVEKQIEQAEQDVALLARHAARTSTVSTPQPRKAGPDSLNVTDVKDAFLSDPKRGFADHREFLMLAMNTAQTGQLTDKRLQSLAVGSDEQSTVSDPYGGFLLPTAFSPDLMSLEAEGDPTMGRTTSLPMQAASIEIPARVDKNHTSSVSGGLRVYRRNEADTSPSSRMEMEQIKLNATMLFGVAHATEELLSRSPISFIALLEAGFSDEFAAKLLNEKLFGTGAGQMEGVVTAPGTVSQAKETGQEAGTIVKENIDKMRARCWRYGNAVWLYNHDCLPQLRSLVQAVGTGGTTVPYFSVDVNGNSTLDGRPAFATEFAETIGTAGDLILGNWSQYLEGTLSGQQSAESIHVRFVNHERTFKFWMENDGKCWWRTPLTPKRGANTLSPFVTLAARA